MKLLLQEISQCQVCSPFFDHKPNPVVTADPNSKIAIIGQAPGTKVHLSGKPWDDASGKKLRNWMGVEEETFYNTSIIAIIPMGFCYPGKGKSGDLPPRKECAPLWHGKLFNKINSLRLVLLIGKYAQDYYLREKSKKNLTETVKSYTEYLPQYFVLPHPSPRNNIWMKKNAWFETTVVPNLKSTIKKVL